MAAVMSWDNLSSKGLINPLPDRLLVWSEHMKREAIALHGIPPDRIIETGSSVHDAFANPARFGLRADNLRRLGLDPGSRIIFYGTNHAAGFPREFEVVREVAQWVEQDVFGVPCQLVVRLHPQAMTGPFATATDPYLKLSSKRVKIDFPSVRDSKLPWDLPEKDLDHLVALLRDADVVINTASTISIDAAILDRPVVSIAYDPAGMTPVSQYYDYTHMAHVIKVGAARIAASAEELQERIATYLKNPSLDREGRRRIVEQQFGRVDGNNAARTANVILGMLRNRMVRTPSSFSNSGNNDTVSLNTMSG
jgi:hypothetical protein